MLKWKLIVLSGVGALVLSGPLQHIGVLPQTAVGDASKNALKLVRDMVVPPALGNCGPDFGSGDLGSIGSGGTFTVSVGSGGGGSAPGGSAGNAAGAGSGGPSTTAGPANAVAGASQAGSSAGNAGSVTAGAAGGVASGAGAGTRPPTRAVASAPASQGFSSAVGLGGGGFGYLPGPVYEEVEETTARVLVVEDDQYDRDRLRVYLQAEGYRVRAEVSLEAGLAALNTFRPSMAIVDRDLAGIDGVEFARRLRKATSGNSDEKRVILAATGEGTEQERRSSIEAGFDFYLTKPIVLDELLRALASVKRPGVASVAATNR
jgi:CheY-like chemotaxis protein